MDAARWFFNSRPDTQMDFDLGLAVREDSENPVYSVSYTHLDVYKRQAVRELTEAGQSVRVQPGTEGTARCRRAMKMKNGRPVLLEADD